jgi:hypothetical protein
MQISTIGLDIAKNVFQVHGIDAAEKVVVRKRLRRRQVLEFFKAVPPCLVGMEACATAHYWARELTKLGHRVRLMPAKDVKAYVKRAWSAAALPRRSLRRRSYRSCCGCDSIATITLWHLVAGSGRRPPHQTRSVGDVGSMAARRPKDAKSRNFGRLYTLLRARRERPSCDGAEDRYEVAPIHAKHGGTSSPRAVSTADRLCPVLSHVQPTAERAANDLNVLNHGQASRCPTVRSNCLAHLPFEHAACECRSCVCRTRPDPNTSVLILPIAFEPFDRSRRQIVGSHSAWRLSRNVGW